MVVEREAVLSVYVRPAGSYVMDQLELRRVAFYPGIDRSESAECVILVGNFSAPAGLRAAEAALSKQQVKILPEFGTVVLPMVKHPFIVGFVVAELPNVLNEMCTDVPSDETLPLNLSNTGSYELPQRSDKRFWEIQSFKDELMKNHGQFTAEKRSMAIMISRSLAMAYVLDQKALLLQQSSWQNNVRMSHLVEQIRGALSSIMSLSKMLSVHLKRSQISFDIVEDILAQGDHMKDALQLLQDAVYLTKANILRYNDETLNKLHDSLYNHRESVRSLPSDNGSQESRSFISQQNYEEKDMEMPMPPPLLLPLLEHNIRPCTVSDVLTDLVGAAVPLADKQQRFLKFNELSHPLVVAVEESALRQAISNLIEGALLRTHVGGRVVIYATAAPAGGALVVVDDDGPDMHYMTQSHSLTPFGADLLSDGMVGDNLTWNFIAGLTVAREILESYGCVIRVISPRTPDAALGAGGTRIELWLPAPESDPIGPSEEG